MTGGGRGTIIRGRFLWQQGNKSQVYIVSSKPGGRRSDQVLSGYWGAGSKGLGVGNRLRGVIHSRERSLRRDQGGGEGGGGRRRGRGGGSGDESCGTIFHRRQKHLLGYQFGAVKQSSPPAPSSIIFSY